MKITVHITPDDPALISLAGRAVSTCVDKGYPQCAFAYGAEGNDRHEAFVKKARAGNYSAWVLAK